MSRRGMGACLPPLPSRNRLGSVLGQLLSAAVPPATRAENNALRPGRCEPVRADGDQGRGEGLIQVFLHHLRSEIAKALAQETDRAATRRAVQTLAVEIAEGHHVRSCSTPEGLASIRRRRPWIWRGEPCACQFMVTAPEDRTGRTFYPCVLVLVEFRSGRLGDIRAESEQRGGVGDRAARRPRLSLMPRPTSMSHQARVRITSTTSCRSSPAGAGKGVSIPR